MDFRWSAKPLPENGKVANLSEALNVSEELATILVQRGVETYDEAQSFFRPKLEDLHDPFLMKDMDIAISRIEKAIENREKMMVFGDYDVDGTTAVSIVYSYFRNFNQNIEYYIPDRYKEGYGISTTGIDYAADNGFTLIIALDCGIRSNKMVDYALSKGVEFIICDHHIPGEKLPNATAILNPKRKDCEYPFKELSGAGIGFKLVEGYSQKHGLPTSIQEEYLDLVAVSIASDLVDIRGENRILAYFGLKKLSENPSIGIQALTEERSVNKQWTISDIVFRIGPRINAAGRIADGKIAVQMLIEKDFNTARNLAKELQRHNTERQSLDSEITHEAIQIVENSSEMIAKKSTVVLGDKWHKGVIGIVASRLVEQFYKPTIVFSMNDDILTGSARSVKDFDIHEAIGECGDLVEQYGGHKYAAGLSIKAENFEAFAEKFEEIAKAKLTELMEVPEIEYDVPLSLNKINDKMLRIINQMSPFGPGNMLPVFKTENLFSNGSAKVLKEKHLKLYFSQNGATMDGIGFGLGHHLPLVSNNKKFNACYSIEENNFNGRTSIQLRLRDIKPA